MPMGQAAQQTFTRTDALPGRAKRVKGSAHSAQQHCHGKGQCHSFHRQVNSLAVLGECTLGCPVPQAGLLSQPGFSIHH